MAGAAEYGLLLAAAGLAWAGWAAWLLRRAGNSLRPAAPPRVLVDEGPYRFGRHPMYLGLALALFGLGLASGTVLPGAAALVLAVLMQQVVIPHEEAQLRRAFGAWYSDYMTDVRRWV
jgi:protein-S-isoprenylcysteine O-methyltransferase Ste14